MKSGRIAVASLALALISPSLSAPAAPSAADGLAILRRVADLYSRAERFYLAGEIRATITTPAGNDSSRASFVAASGGKGRLRDQLDSPGSGMMRVSDGLRSWAYVGQLGQYVERSEAFPTPDTMDSTQIQELGGVVGALLNTYRGIAQRVDSVQVLRVESVRLAGRARPCDVVRARYQNTSGDETMVRTYWVERDHGWVLKQQTMLLTTGEEGSVTRSEMLTLRRVSINEPVPDSVFTFRPPAGARKVDRIAAPGVAETDLTGQVAADFSLSDLEGHTHSLSGQRGKVVMLDFWATWCGPCRLQMPAVDRLYQEFKDKGLVVFAVNQGEPAERARAYLRKHSYSTTTLLDSGGEVGRQYQVHGIPTLVIVDREGKIVAHWVGVRPEGMLREGLKRAGIQ